MKRRTFLKLMGASGIAMGAATASSLARSKEHSSTMRRPNTQIDEQPRAPENLQMAGELEHSEEEFELEEETVSSSMEQERNEVLLFKERGTIYEEVQKAVKKAETQHVRKILKKDMQELRDLFEKEIEIKVRELEKRSEQTHEDSENTIQELEALLQKVSSPNIDKEAIDNFEQMEITRIFVNEREKMMKKLFNHNRILKEKYLDAFVENKDTLLPIIKKASEEHGVPLWVLVGLIGVESGGDPHAKNEKSGAAGIMQIMKRTGRKTLGLQIRNGIDERLDPEIAIPAGAKYLKKMYDRFGQWSLAMVAYSGGPSKLDRRIQKWYKRAGVKKRDMKDPEVLMQKGVNIVTLYSKYFTGGGIGNKSVSYPVWVEMMAEEIEGQLNT